MWRVGVWLIVAGCLEAPRRTLDLPLRVSPVPAELASGARTWSLTSARLDLNAARFRGPVEVAGVWAGLLPVAHAHPGHEPGSDVVGEWLGPASVDLLAGGNAGTVRVFEGKVASVDLDLGAARLDLVGSVRDGEGAPVAFHLVLDEADTVYGSALVGTLDADAAPSALTLVVDLDTMLGDLGSVALPVEGTWTLSPEGAAHNTWSFATLRSDLYTWEITP